MKYGLSRAVPMGIFGFLFGMFLAILLRALQGLDPTWDAEIGIVLGAIFCSIFFVWSMGAFDPAMSAHGEEGHGDEEHAVHAPAEEAKPHVSLNERLHRAIASVLRFTQSGGVMERLLRWLVAIVALLVLGLVLVVTNVVNYARRIAGDIFLVTTITLVVLLFLAVLATVPGGPSIQITNDPVGSPTGNGYVTINLFGTDYIFSKLTLFLIFAIWTIVSLALAGGAISLLMAFLAREVRSVKGKPPPPEALTPPLPLRLISRGATWLLNRLPEPPKPQR